MRDVVAEYRARGFRPSRSAGGRSAARSTRRLDEAIVRGRARGGRRGREAVRRRGRERRPLAARPQMGDAHGRDAEGLRRRLVRGGAAAGRPRRLLPTSAARQPGADRRRRGADAAAGLPALADAGRLRHRPAGRHQGRRHQRAAPHRLDWPTISASSTVGHGWNTALGRRRRPAARLGLPRRPTSSSSSAAAPTSTASWPSPSSSIPTAILPSPTAPGSASPSTARSSRASRPILRRCSAKGSGMRSGRIGGPCTAGGDNAA